MSDTQPLDLNSAPLGIGWHVSSHIADDRHLDRCEVFNWIRAAALAE
jgi:hypothetical protein